MNLILRLSAQSFDFLIALLQLFEPFDIKENGVIGFDESVCSLSIFHPDALERGEIFYFVFTSLSMATRIKHVKRVSRVTIQNPFSPTKLYTSRFN